MIPLKSLDVAIIGAGQIGLSLAFALRGQGIHNVRLFDQAPAGYEGPWATTARMLTLRTPKDIPDPALGFSSLTFKTWYEASQGPWNPLDKIPTDMWMEYLRWFRHTLDLPVTNQHRLLSIHPQDKSLALHFDKGTVFAKKVVLATGRGGCGGWKIPPFVASLPKSRWYHTAEKIDPAIFHQKRICVIGCAASAFDIAAIALENGAESVYMLMRRAALPERNPLAEFSQWETFHSLSDQERIALIAKARQIGTCPPPESIERVVKWDNFKLLAGTEVQRIDDRDELEIHTHAGVIAADLLLLGTGYKVDVDAVVELSPFSHEILRWGDRHPDMPVHLSAYPYLGPHFEFLERHPGKAPFLQNIHCFNHGALLSLGRIAGDIDQMPIGVKRLLTSCFEKTNK